MKATDDVLAIRQGVPPELQNNIIPLKINSTDPLQISQAVKTYRATILSLPKNSRELIGIINCSKRTQHSLEPLESFTSGKWLDVFNTNTIGPMNIISAFLPLLRDSGGRIINVSNAGALTCSPLEGPFCSSKIVI